jgi:hypothetical protein
MCSRWPKVVAALEPLIALGESPVAVRTYQRGRGDRGDPKFGRLGWDEKSHARWPLRSGSHIEFGNMELWAPSWTRCVKRDCAPDVFFSMSNPAMSGPRPGASSVLLLAVAKSLGRQSTSIGRKVANDVADVVTTVARRCRRQPWGRIGEYGLISDVVEYLLVNMHSDIFKPDWEESRAPIDSLFVAGWKPF